MARDESLQAAAALRRRLQGAETAHEQLQAAATPDPNPDTGPNPNPTPNPNLNPNPDPDSDPDPNPNHSPHPNHDPHQERRGLLSLRAFGRALIGRDARRGYFALTPPEQHAVIMAARVRVRVRVRVGVKVRPQG